MAIYTHALKKRLRSTSSTAAYIQEVAPSPNV